MGFNKGWQISGCKEIEFVLTNFAKKDAQKILKKAMRQELNPVAKEIRQLFPKDSGKTAKSIKPKMSTRRGRIYVNIQSSDDNYLVKFLELGTMDHKGNVKQKPRSIKNKIKNIFGSMDKNGKWHIKPHQTFTNVYKHRSEPVKQRIIQRFYDDAKSALGDLIE